MISVLEFYLVDLVFSLAEFIWNGEYFFILLRYFIWKCYLGFRNWKSDYLRYLNFHLTWFFIPYTSVLCFSRDTDLLWLQVCFGVMESFSAGLGFTCSLCWKGFGSEVQGHAADIRGGSWGDPAFQALWAPMSLAVKHRDWANVSILSSF